MCNKVGHLARDYRSSGNTNVANTHKGNGANPKGNGCFECGAPGHFKRDFGNAKKRGNASRNPYSNVVTSTFLLNNHYASILFDTGADRSFISTAFSSLINIAPTPLENNYDVELADGKIVGINTIIRGCTLSFLDHLFNIDLMPVEQGVIRNLKSAGKGSLNVAHGSYSNTPIIDKIDKLECQILDGKLMFVDDDGNPLVPKGNVDSESEVEVVFEETANLMASTSFKGESDQAMAICDDLDITVRGRKKK
ncbi:putative reverse transcriptase domain-containing protein [Tanacetum coccineum]